MLIVNPLLLVTCTILSHAAQVVHTARLYRNAKRSSITFYHWKRCLSVDCTDRESSDSSPDNIDTGDLLVTGLNGAQDISVKVVSCREGTVDLQSLRVMCSQSDNFVS